MSSITTSTASPISKGHAQIPTISKNKDGHGENDARFAEPQTGSLNGNVIEHNGISVE